MPELVDSDSFEGRLFVAGKANNRLDGQQEEPRMLGILSFRIHYGDGSPRSLCFAVSTVINLHISSWNLHPNFYYFYQLLLEAKSSATTVSDSSLAKNHGISFIEIASQAPDRQPDQLYMAIRKHMQSFIGTECYRTYLVL